MENYHLDYKEIKPVNPKGNQPWMFIGRTDADADVPLLWPPDAKSQLMWKDSDAQKNWTQKEKRAAEDQMVRQHHQLNGYEFEQTLGDSEGQGAWQSNGSQSWPWLFLCGTQLTDWKTTTTVTGREEGFLFPNLSHLILQTSPIRSEA